MKTFCVQNHYDYMDEYAVVAETAEEAEALADEYAYVSRQPRPWTCDIAARAPAVLDAVRQTATKKFVDFTDCEVHETDTYGRWMD